MARDCGAQWLTEYYRGHEATVFAKATENSSYFLNTLANKVAALELESEITKDLMATTMSEPSFSVLLQKAVLTSAQTENPQKHEILSDVVSQRLKSSAESVYSATCQIAVDAIAHCTTNQLHVLALAVSLRYISPALPPDLATEEAYKEACKDWLNHRLAPYANLKIGPLDFAHLEAISCLKFDAAIIYSMDNCLNLQWRRGHFTIDQDFLYSLPVGEVIRRAWEQDKLNKTTLTTAGILIGNIASDRLCGAGATNFASWQAES